MNICTLSGAGTEAWKYVPTLKGSLERVLQGAAQGPIQCADGVLGCRHV